MIVMLGSSLTGINQIRTQTVKTSGVVALIFRFYFTFLVRLLVIFVAKERIADGIIDSFVETQRVIRYFLTLSELFGHLVGSNRSLLL